ncbi:MAG: hypothetical protein UY93_C0002G0085 [Parcubacteria group bacterium GW2011_GWA1_56_13]|nr:MAG: hypothetical protein UY93_C0002G0085 [Parcubacteria group bacterium GW2011_GWA1_56_13]
MGQVNADNTYTYGNENANDYYIRASGKWASQLGGGVSSVGLSCYDAAASCWPGSGTKTDRYCQVCVNGVCSGYTNTGSIRDACDYGGWY